VRREGFGFALFHLAFVFWFAFGSISFLAFFSATLTHVVCLSPYLFVFQYHHLFSFEKDSTRRAFEFDSLCLLVLFR